jgi:hypothetical protein
MKGMIDREKGKTTWKHSQQKSRPSTDFVFVSEYGGSFSVLTSELKE